MIDRLMRKSTAARILGWCLLLGGAVLTAWAVLTVLDARASLGWPTTTGVVESAAVERRVSRTSGSERKYRYNARVLYAYRVDGEAFFDGRLSFLTDYYDSAEEARDVVRRYPAGSEVTVYYKPGDPSVAVLESNYGYWTYLPLGISLFLFIAGAVFVNAARQQAQKERPRTPV